MRTHALVLTVAVAFASDANAQFSNTPPAPPNVERPPAGNPGEEPPGAAQPNPIFTALDTDGDGVISKVELRKAIKALRTLDTDNDGNITLAEAGAYAAPAAPGSPDVERMLAEHDKNGDGKLTADEVPPHIMPLLQGADKNGDRAIDKDELQAAIEASRFGGGPGGRQLGANGLGADPRTGQFLRHDVNNDGRLTIDEIPRQMRPAFRPEDDRNGDGAIDAAELQIVLARMGGAARAAGAGAQPGGDPNTFRDPNRRNRPRTDDQD